MIGRIGGIEVLFVCTGNMCRSPMAEGIARRAFDERHVAVTVRSVGISAPGSPITGKAAALLAGRGIDMDGHVSRPVDPEALRRADLVIGMARRHVREVAMLEPTVLPRAFTLKELVRRATEQGPRAIDEPVRSWAAALTADRTPRSLIGSSAADDIDDPFGQGTRSYEKAFAEIEAAIGRLVELVDPRYREASA